MESMKTMIALKGMTIGAAMPSLLFVMKLFCLASGQDVKTEMETTSVEILPSNNIFLPPHSLEDHRPTAVNLNVTNLSSSDAFPINMYYPDFEGANKGCFNDGGEPGYMSLKPHEWMYDSLSSCCESVYYYMKEECIANGAKSALSTPSAVPSLPSSDLYYPNVAGDDDVCKNDGNAPEYMKRNPAKFMSTTLDACCKENYEWRYEECMGKDESSTTQMGGNRNYGGNKWYASYKKSVCVKNCVYGRDDAQCGGKATQDDKLFDDVGECCQTQLSWVRKSVCEAASQGFALSGTNDWYYDRTTGTCQQDCEGGSSCGGIAKVSDRLFESKAFCCDTNAPGNSEC